ncbi:MAG: hypothetical protein QF363_03095 [Planctomycetaceae bacterium]|nr:hypothetical protein [Planctomycetaceae bacterium]
MRPSDDDTLRDDDVDSADEVTGPGEADPQLDSADEATADAQSEIRPATTDSTGGSDEDDLPEWEPLTPELVEEEAERGDFMLRWATVLLAFLLGCYGIHQSTTLLHTAAGRYLAGHGVLPPSTDVFSLTAIDRPWVNLNWGTDLLLAGLYSLPGQDIWLSLFAAIAGTVTLGLVVHVTRPGIPTWWSSVMATVALLVCFPQFVAGPESLTLLGLATQMWLLHRWSLSDRPRDLWLAVGVQCLWANLDPRAWIGLFLLLLYGAGELLGARMERPALLGAERRRLYWKVVAAAVAASLINPFHVHTLLAPVMLYGTEYPALRPYHLIGLGQDASIDRLQYYPLTAILYFRGHWGNWSWINYHVIAGSLLVVTAGFTLYLNRRRVDLGHVAVLGGFTLLALLGVRELAPAALVAAVLAGLNGQDWFKASFPQQYSTEPRELLFSRGGRAVTVLTFFALAFLGITGRLTSENGRKLGLGFSPTLSATVDGMIGDLNERLFTVSANLDEELDRGDVTDTLRKLFISNKISLPKQVALESRQPGVSWTLRGTEPDNDFLIVRGTGRLVVYRDHGRNENHRGFNFVPEQGDLMIWIGHRPFIDSRVRLYAGRDDQDLLNLHRKTRAALRLRTFVIGPEGRQQILRAQVANETADEIEVILSPGGSAAHQTLKKSDLGVPRSPETLYPVPQTGDSRVWQLAFDTHRISHVLPRLGGSPNPDYLSMFALFQYPMDWQLTHIGSTTAVFYRKADALASMKPFLDSHKFDFINTAFRTVADKLEPRPELARADAAYTSYLKPKRPRSVPAIDQATHFAQILKRRRDNPAFQGALQELALRLANQDLTGGSGDLEAMTILADTAAVAFLTIRSANEGLTSVPNNSRGFLALGMAYAVLDDIESAFRGGKMNSPSARRRYFQTILALNQVLELDANNTEALFERYQRLSRFNRVDLALDSLRRFDTLSPMPKRASEQQKELRRREVDDPLQTMISEVERLKGEIERAFAPETGSEPPDRLQLAIQLTQEQADRPVFIRTALELINQDAQLAANPQVRVLKARWMMEAGVFRDEATATTLEELFQELGEQAGQLDIRTTIAITRLAFADYDHANQLWQGELAQLEQTRLGDSLRNMPLFLRPQQWPFDQINSTMNLVLLLPESRSEILFNVAASHLEAGRVNQAGDELVRLLDTVPDSHLRPLAQFYLSLITRKQLELIDNLAPAEMIPVEPGMFQPESDQPVTPPKKGTAAKKNTPTKQGTTSKKSDPPK